MSSDNQKLNIKKVLTVLKKIEPALQMHGGGVKFIDLDPNGVVKLQLQGHCAGCAMSAVTLKHGIEKVLMEQLPEIVTGVEEA